MLRRAIAPFLLALLSACAPPPEAERALPPVSAGSDYPALLPLARVDSLDAGPTDADRAAADALTARAAALRRRASAL